MGGFVRVNKIFARQMPQFFGKANKIILWAFSSLLSLIDLNSFHFVEKAMRRWIKN